MGGSRGQKFETSLTNVVKPRLKKKEKNSQTISPLKSYVIYDILLMDEEDDMEIPCLWEAPCTRHSRAIVTKPRG